MTYYIRPRQDISLSRAAQMMRTLVLLDYEPTMHVYKAEQKPEMLVRINSDDLQIYEKAVAQLVDLDKFNFSNFKIVDLGPYEERVEVD